MADRYWVGGTANWDGTAGTKWSATDGGGGGASVPTSGDNVFFTLLSGAVTVTITATANCLNITCTGFAGTLAGSNNIQIAGSLTFSAAMTVSYTGNSNFTAASGSRTITSAGKSFTGGVNIGQNGSSTATFTLQDALTTTTGNTLVITSGTFTTNNFNITTSAFSSNNSNVRTINIGSSTITVTSSASALNLTTNTNLTLDAGTSTFVFNNTGSISLALGTGGRTLYNVSVTSTISNITFDGALIVNNFTTTATTGANLRSITLGGSLTVNGTLTINQGTTSSARVYVLSSVAGTTRTLTVNAFAATGDIDFRDIAVTGTAAPISGTRFSDCKGNSGITFDAAKTVYYRGTGSVNWGATVTSSWSLTSGGGADFAAFPLAQDTAVIPAATYPASGSTITINVAYNIGTIDLSLRTANTVTISNATSPDILGNFIGGTGVTYSGTGTFTYSGRTTQTITSAGRTFTQQLNINSPSGTVLLADAFTTSRSATGAITLTRGTFDAAGYSVTLTGALAGINANNANVRTLAFGSGTWTIAGTGGFNATDATNLTVTGTGIISLTNASAKSFIGGGIQTYPTLNQGGAGALTVTGSNKFADITNSAIGSVLFTAGTTTTFDNFNLNGTAGNLLTLGSVTAASHTLSKVSGTVSSDYLSISRSTATGGATWYAGANSSDGGNNSGWIFSAPPVVASSNMFLLF
jgi:hypothetical protein